MHDELIKKLILKHFQNFELGIRGRYHGVSYDDLRRLIEDVLQHHSELTKVMQIIPPVRGMPDDQLRLVVAGQILGGLTDAKASEKVCVAKALSAADSLIFEHARTKNEFWKSLEAAYMDGAYGSTT